MEVVRLPVQADVSANECVATAKIDPCAEETGSLKHAHSGVSFANGNDNVAMLQLEERAATGWLMSTHRSSRAPPADLSRFLVAIMAPSSKPSCFAPRSRSCGSPRMGNPAGYRFAQLTSTADPRYLSQSGYGIFLVL